MRTKIREINSEWSEERIYDDDDKLVEIRKIYSSDKLVRPQSTFDRQRSGYRG